MTCIGFVFYYVVIIYSFYCTHMNPITAVLSTTNWWFVVVAVIVSIMLWGARFNIKTFGNLYIKRMKFPKDTPKPDGRMMAYQFGWEALSKLLYYIGLWQAFQIAGWEWFGNNLILAFVVYLMFSFSTQLSDVSWSFPDRRVLRLLLGKWLVECVLATSLWYLVF